MEPLRIVSYNVRYFSHALKGLSSTHRSMQGVADALCGLHPLADVICLQEVETVSLRSAMTVKKGHPEETQLERFMRLMEAQFAARGQVSPYRAFYFPAHQYKLSARANIYTTGLAVIVRDGVIVERHNADRPHDITHRGLEQVKRAKQTRICAHLRLGGEHGLHLFNTHLSLPSPFAREFWTTGDRMGHGPNQLLEVEKLLAFVKEQSRGEPFVIMGDFNSNPGSPVYRFVTEGAGLVDAQAKLQKASISELRAWPTAGFMQLRMHLDHLFSSPGVHWLDVQESHPFGDKKGRFHGLSDHVPWVARLALRA
jgi:endonuclease/exonuclease/phosphatase family metal-dependent hydrolase